MRIIRRIFLMAIAYFVCLASAIAQDTSKKLQIEEDGFQWFLLQKTNSDGRTVWGAESIDGETIIPIQNGYHLISYKKERNPFFYVIKYVTITKKKAKQIEGIYSVQGEEIIPTKRGYNSIYYQDYSGIGYFSISKDTVVYEVNKGKRTNKKIEISMDGACDIKGKEIVPPQYYGLLYTAEGFVYGNDWPMIKLNVFLNDNGTLSSDNVGKILEKKNGLQWYKIFKDGVFGILDLEGNEIIPLSRGYSSIYYEENHGGLFSCQKEDGTIIKCDVNGNVMSVYDLMRRQEESMKSIQILTENQKTKLKVLFDQANSLPNTDTQKKYDMYMQVANADSDGTFGYKAVALNNIGVMYYNLGDYKNAKIYFEQAVAVAPSYTDAQNNLKLAKSAKRSQTWSKIGSAVSAIGQTFGTMSGTNIGNESFSTSGYGASGLAQNNVSQGGSMTSSNDGKTMRIDLPDGSYQINTMNDDGSMDSKHVNVCFTCHGSKICQACLGQKGKYMSYSGIYYPCTMCNQTGLCSACKGQGTTTLVTHVDADGNGYGVSSNGYTTTKTAGGVMVTDPNGRTTAHPSGSGDSSTKRERRSNTSGRGTCSKCGGKKYESASYSALPASTYGWAQPYHHSGGSGCPYCTSATDHYHAPCTECRGYGQN